MTELKPCPFCGVEPEVLSDMGCTWGLIKHRDGCFFPNFRHQQIPEYEFEAWNMRHVETCKLNELDALTQTLSMVDGCAWGECSECGCLTPDDSTYCINCGRKVEG